MTDQELNARRLAAWDNYEASRQKLTALKSKIQEWGAELRKAADRCSGHPFRVHENDLSTLPNREEVIKTIAEARAAISQYRQYRQQAADFRFPVEADQTLDSSDFELPR